MARAAAVVMLLASLAGCVSSTEFGPCVGAFDDQNPALLYKLSARNLTLGVVFFEMIAPPILVVTGETFCPVAVRPVPRTPPAQ